MVDMKKVREEEETLISSTEKLVDELHEMTTSRETNLRGYLLEGTGQGVLLRSPLEAGTTPKSCSVPLPEELHPSMLAYALLGGMGQQAMSYIIFVFGQHPQGVPGRFRRQVREALEAILRDAKETQAACDDIAFNAKAQKHRPTTATMH